MAGDHRDRGDDAGRVRLLYAVFFLSGVAGLGYQMVWTRMFALGLGHEIPGVLAVVAAFFGGLALGAWVLDGPVSRSRRPGRWYVGLEAAIGLWGFVSVALIPWCNELAFGLMGVEPSAFRHWLIAFVIPLVALSPATIAMGATLPAMERFVAPMTRDGRCVGGLYAANTAGAVVGTLGSAFVFMPWLGLSRAVCVLAAVNLLCAIAVGAMKRGVRVDDPRVAELVNSDDQSPSKKTQAAIKADRGLSDRRVLVTVFMTGLLGIGYEALGVRVLSQVLENTVYSFAAVLSIYLLGTAVGAALYQGYGVIDKRKSKTPEAVSERASGGMPVGVGCWVGGICVACLVGVYMLSHAKALYAWARNDLFGDSLLGVMGCEMIVAAAVFALPTLLMGATFSHLVQAAKREWGGVGLAAAVNTVGAALAPLVFGVVLLPAVGAKAALVAVSLAYLLLIPLHEARRWVTRPAPVGLAVLLGGLVLAPMVWGRDLQVVTKRSDMRVIDYREGVMAAVAVLETKQGARSLRVNNRFRMGSTDGAVFECLQAQTALLLHPRPKRALFLGLGTAITFRASAFEPGLKADGVELVPEVAAVSDYFKPVNLPDRYRRDQRIYIADARRYVRATDQMYDVVIADLFHPGRDGAGSLYTVEHFNAVRSRLAPGGLFCQWLPLYQMDETTLKVIIRTFLRVFPHSAAYLVDFNIANPALGLVGSLEPTSYPPSWFEDRVKDNVLRRYLKALLVSDGVRLFGAFVAGADELQRYAGVGPVNTDDRPVLTFEAPRFTQRQDATTYGTLMAILEACEADVSRVVSGDGGRGGVDDATDGRLSGAFVDRVTRYIQARDIYFRGLVAYQQGDRVRAVDDLIAAGAISEDFTAGYAGCLAIAAQQVKADRMEVRALLRRLIDANPSRPEAKQWLRQLDAR